MDGKTDGAQGAQPITGYRNLSDQEIKLINDIKAHAEETRHLVHRVQQHINNTPNDVNQAPPSQITSPARWAAIATTDLQQGFMALTRAVAQPTTF